MSVNPTAAEHEVFTGVIAHGLLNSLSAVRGALSNLANPDLPIAVREEMFAMALRHVELMTAMLRDLVLGLPPEVALYLDELDAKR
jgi:acyl dehydratase